YETYALVEFDNPENGITLRFFQEKDGDSEFDSKTGLVYVARDKASTAEIAQGIEILKDPQN
ncbi:MAG: hypothetical protein ACRCWQ_03695, partial [Bacilli bacterium]